MPKAEISMVLFGILGFCAFLALGGYLGKILSPGKLVTIAGVIALVAVVCFSIFSAYYFVTIAK